MSNEAPQLTAYADGVGQVYASQLNTFLQTCDNLAQLREFTGTIGLQVFVRGYEDVGDGGQGNFYWDPNGVGPDNAETIIVPTGADSGAWVRLDYASFLSLFLPKTSEIPAANVAGGFLYVDATGALRYRGPTTDTELAPP